MVLEFDFPIALHFEILKWKQIFRCNGYPSNFVDHCTKIYLDKVFIKHLNICIVQKKELIFPFLAKKPLEIKKCFQNYTESNLRHCKLKSFSNLHLKLWKIFIFRIRFLKNSVLRMFIVLSVIAGTLFVMEKKCHCYIRAAEHMGHSTNV